MTSSQSGVVPVGLEYFSYLHFEARVHALISQVLADPALPFGSQ